MALRHPHHVPDRQLPLSGRARASGAVGARTTHRKPRWQDEVSTVSGWRAAGLELVAPGVLGAFEAAARGALPLRLGGQILSRPARIGEGVAEGDVDHGMVHEIVDRASGPQGVPPVGPRLETPPAAEVVEPHRPRGRHEDERARVDHLGRDPGVRARIGRALRLGHVARLLHEAGELRVRHGRPVHPEAVDGHAVGGRLLGIVAIRAHEEGAAGHVDHPGEGGSEG